MTSKSKPIPQAKISPPEPKPTPAVIVFGADQANKPRAASFTGHSERSARGIRLVCRSARAMGRSSRA